MRGGKGAKNLHTNCQGAGNREHQVLVPPPPPRSLFQPLLCFFFTLPVDVDNDSAKHNDSL